MAGWKTTIFLIGDTSSHAGFSIAMLVYQEGIYPFFSPPVLLIRSFEIPGCFWEDLPAWTFRLWLLISSTWSLDVEITPGVESRWGNGESVATHKDIWIRFLCKSGGSCVSYWQWGLIFQPAICSFTRRFCAFSLGYLLWKTVDILHINWLPQYL